MRAANKSFEMYSFFNMETIKIHLNTNVPYFLIHYLVIEKKVIS